MKSSHCHHCLGHNPEYGLYAIGACCVGPSPNCHYQVLCSKGLILLGHMWLGVFLELEGGGGDAGASTCLSPAGKLSCDWVMSSPQRSEVGGHQVVGGFTHHGLCVFEEPEDRMSVWASPSCCQEAVLGLGDHASQRSVGFHFS